MLDYLFAALLGVIEGITEWLPISSTGHLILADEFIHMSTSDAFKEMFDVVIQFGAILAVVVIFWSKLWPFRINRDACGSGVSGLVDRYCRKDVWDMWFHVLVAIVPSAVIGLPLDDWMTEHLHNPPVVSAMLILYGVFFLLMESTVGKRRPQVRRIGQINYRMALFIGLFQFLALVPGTSRSGATILGAMLIGCSRTHAGKNKRGYQNTDGEPHRSADPKIRVLRACQQRRGHQQRAHRQPRAQQYKHLAFCHCKRRVAARRPRQGRGLLPFCIKGLSGFHFLSLPPVFACRTLPARPHRPHLARYCPGSISPAFCSVHFATPGPTSS